MPCSFMDKLIRYAHLGDIVGILKRAIFFVILLPFWAAGNSLTVISGGAGGYAVVPGLIITNGPILGIGSGEAIGGGTPITIGTPTGGNGLMVHTPEITILGGNFVATGAPPAAFGILFNDSNVTLSGGTFSSIGLQDKTNGNSTATISSGAQIETGDGVWLGVYGSGSALSVESNATLRGDAMVLGYASTASRNILSVTKNGALLDTREIHIGGSADGAGGTGNRIEVGNGGTVTTTELNIYAGNTFDLNTGGTLAVRTNFNASMSGFTWNDGGQLSVQGDLDGMDEQSLSLKTYETLDGVNRTLLLDGGSWTRDNKGIAVGWSGSENSLVITNGGTVFSGLSGRANGAFIGFQGGIGYSGLSSNNSVVVTGNGSSWESPHSGLQIGYLGSRNSLSILDGGYVGAVFGSIGVFGGGNSVFVSGENSVWSNQSSLILGTLSSGNLLEIYSGGRVYSSSGYVGYGSWATSNRVVVSGDNSIWINQTAVIGYLGSSNSLLIDDGGLVLGNKSFIGRSSLASNNWALVSGEGSTWNNSEALYLGGRKDGANWIDGGTGNSLTVSNGGWVQVGDVGTNDFPDVGTLGVVSVGSLDGSAEMVVANGSRVQSDRLILGNRVNETGTLQIQGSSEVSIGVSTSWVWNENSVIVGRESGGNELEIRDGGILESRGGTIGETAGANANRVRVVGAGSQWLNFSGMPTTICTLDYPSSFCSTSYNKLFYVGLSGSSNQLEVLDGGQVLSTEAVVGKRASSMDNRINVTGNDATWRVDYHLTIGEQGSRNQLTVGTGGQVYAGGLYVGREASANSNLVVVSGKGALLSVGPRPPFSGILPISQALPILNQELGSEPILNQPIPRNPFYEDLGDFRLGTGGKGNVLMVSAGGEVRSGNGIIGLDETAQDNTVLVTGDGSLWDSEGVVTVGMRGSGNSLQIEAGARVRSESGYIGESAGAEDNRVVVSGQGSSWNVGPDFFMRYSSFPGFSIGYAGSDNSLLIENGGQMQNVNGVIGYAENANGNRMLVTGSGSVWKNTGGWDFSEPRPIQGLDPRSGSGQILPPSTFPIGLDPLTGQSIPGNMDWREVSKIESSVFFLRPGINPITGETIPVYESVETGRVYLTNATIVAQSMGDLSVGRGGSYNRLDITDGALVSNDHGIIGETSNAWNNAVSVEGANSEWRNSGALYIGGRMSSIFTISSNGWENSWVDGGQGNSLYVADGGLVSIGRDMHNRNDSLVNIEAGGQISVAGNYYQDATSVLRFGVETNSAGAPLNPFVSVGGTAEFETGATLQYYSNVGLLDFDTLYTNLIVAADQLIIGGVTNATATDLDAINLEGSLVEVLLWEDNQDIYGLVGRRYLADSAGFESDSPMAGVSRGIDDLSLLGNPLAVEQINRLNRMSSARQKAQLTQRYAQGTPTYRHQQSMQGGQRQVLAQTRAFQSGNRGAKPEGAAGPHQAEQGLRGWMRGYGSWAEHDGTSSSSGFDQNVYGTVVGLDRAFGPVLLGAAGGYSQSDLTQNNNDSSDAKTGFGVLYASIGTTDWFADLNASYGRSAIQTRSGTVLGGAGDFDADLYAIYLGGGKEIQLTAGGLLLTPELAMTVGYYDQEGYTDGLMDIDAYGRWSIQSRLGAALAFETQACSILWKPEVRAYWLHEFNADPDRLGYTLGGGRYSFGVQSPDEEIFEAGAGLSATLNDRLELALDLDGQYSENYSALTVGARAMYEF